MEDYVHQNIGVIWRGTDLNPLPLLWEYGQVPLVINKFGVYTKYRMQTIA